MTKTMISLIATTALSLTAGAASAQATVDVLVNGEQDYMGEGDNGLVEVSIVLYRNGATDGFFSSFSGWSQFAGDLVATGGTFIAPVEGPTPGETQADAWEGRRPPAFPVPGGSAGGFRFSPDNSVTSGGTISNIEGIAASTALGGFSHDSSDSIVVYRATLDISGFAFFDQQQVTFEPSLLQVFINGFSIERAVLDNTQINGATVGFIPAPVTAAPLGLACLCARRRRGSTDRAIQ